MQRVEHTRFLGLRVWVSAAVLAALLGIGALALSPTQNRHALLGQLQRRATPAVGAVTAAPARLSGALIRATP